jgi:5'-nucleotidase
VRQLLAKLEWPRRGFLNINFPDCAPDSVSGEQLTFLSTRVSKQNALGHHLNPSGVPHIWCGPQDYSDAVEPGGDAVALAEGKISITPMHADLTHQGWLLALRDEFDESQGA